MPKYCQADNLLTYDIISVFSILKPDFEYRQLDRRAQQATARSDKISRGSSLVGDRIGHSGRGRSQ